jgi:hypothetical protein
VIRRALAFLLLFGGGLGALMAVSGAKLRIVRPKTSVSAQIDEGAGVRIEDPESLSAVLVPSGSLEYVRALETESGWARRFEIVAPDSRMGEGGLVRLEQLRLNLFDPERGTLFGVVEAAIGRTALEPSLDGLQPELSSNIELEQVTLQLLSGTRLVPLVLTTERLSGNLESGTFRTESFAEVVGSGLNANGTGLVLDMGAGLVRFGADAVCAVSGAGSLAGAESTGNGRLACAGPLEIRRVVTADGDRVELDAQRRARLSVDEGGGLRLEARRIRLTAEAGANDDGPLAFEDLVGEGEVALFVEGHQFGADRATFQTDGSGELADARLEGSPAAWLHFGESDGGRDREQVVQVRGDTSMTLTWAPRVSFLVAGPARLTWEQTILTAAGGLSGSPPDEGAPARFKAWTGVRVDHEGWRVTTSELDGSITGGDPTDEQRFSFSAVGDTLIEGATDDRREVKLRALEGLDFAGSREAWTVPSAKGVQLTFASEPPLDATADRLIDFDPIAQSFVATGAVELTASEALLRGTRLVADGRDSLDLFSDGQQLVSYDAAAVHVEARRISRRRNRVVARDEVHADLALDPFRAEVDADQLELFGAGLLEDAERRNSGATTMIATGAVRAKLVEAEEYYDLEGSYLWLERVPTPDAEAALSNLRMSGNVRAEGRSDLGWFELRSRELSGYIFDTGVALEKSPEPEDSAEGQLTATGGVWMRTLDERRIVARAEQLTLNPLGGAILEPSGDELVEVEGEFPGNQRPFSLTARRVEFGSDRLVAARPTITFERSAIAAESTPLDGLRATALELEALPTEVELRGAVSVLGLTPEGKLWTLLAQRTRFEGSSDEDERFVLSRMVADGGVEIDYTDGPRAEGDRLLATVWSGRVRLEGEPALIHLRGHATGSSWFEFDTSNFLLRAGPGWIGATSAGDVE